MTTLFDAPFPRAAAPITRALSLASRRVLTSLAIYLVLAGAGVLMASAAQSDAARAFGLGLVAPGAGFLHWGAPGSDTQVAALLLAAACGAAFGTALILWFGTGNVVLPPLVWLVSAIAAAFAPVYGIDASPSAVWGEAVLWIPPIALALVAAAGLTSAGTPRSRTARPMSWVRTAKARACDGDHEIAPDDLCRMRLLLDRALQPVDRFDGFEWRDQFQTAAVRYQVNFLSYALSVVQARHVPAFTGYMTEAQRRLLAKQSDHRLWRYWALENAWGHLRLGADPVPRGNIMYSGFVAAQIACAEAAGGQSIAREGVHLRLDQPGGRRSDYDVDQITGILIDQYRSANWGLLSCEPHWIYPLCNIISATAVRARDAHNGTEHWAGVAKTFRDGLIRNFSIADGRLVPFRSSLTGLAFPAAGGIVMQAFPCLFLNSLFPDLAEDHWSRVSADLARRKWTRAFWPVDVGNYGFSRASTIAASAAAAAEMGDSALAAAMLDFLDEQCPAVTMGGVSHRPRASLWAHALELIARTASSGTFAGLINDGPCVGTALTPHIADARYPDVLVATAQSRDGRLTAVLYPGMEPGVRPIALGGLAPGRHYRAEGAARMVFRAAHDGTADMDVIVDGRSPLIVTPVT